jgi:hypothetical protein
MSIDVGIIITKEKKRNRINLVEIGLSNGYKETKGHYKTAEEALSALQKIQEEMYEYSSGYEQIIIKGF